MAPRIGAENNPNGRVLLSSRLPHLIEVACHIEGPIPSIPEPPAFDYGHNYTKASLTVSSLEILWDFFIAHML